MDIETKIKKEQFGKNWPFTVDKGILRRRGNLITFIAKGKEYAINGLACSLGIYKDITTIWKKTGRFIENSPKHVDISPIIKKGLSL
jgi:hypothetical protein